MKKLLLSGAVLSLLFVSCKNEQEKTTSTTTSTDTIQVASETAEAEKPMDSAAMMKAWQEYATPGEVHKALAADTGKWNCEMTFWQNPGAAPEKATTTADIKMVFDGKYQESVYKGDMMGMPFEGKATMGYNNASGKVFSTFYDNMGTGIMYVEGDYDASKKMFSMKGEMMDPMSKKMKKFREEYTVLDENTRRMSMFDQAPGGGEYKSMEIVMTRAK